jgi:hypothetical protein
MMVKRFFDAWIDTIYNRDTKNVAYYTDIIGEIQITMGSDSGDSVYSISIIDAYPVQIASVSLDWAQKNEYAKLGVTITFSDIKVELREGIFTPFQGLPRASEGSGNFQGIQQQNKPGFSIDPLISELPGSFKNNEYSSILTEMSNGITSKFISPANPYLSGLINF